MQKYCSSWSSPEAIQCVTGPGGSVGDAISADPRVRKISFTGSRDIGEHICKTAGLKKVTMELGSNSPLIVMADADLEKVAAATMSLAVLQMPGRFASPPSASWLTRRYTPTSWMF